MAKTKVNLTALKKMIDDMPKQAALASNRAISAILEKKMKDLISKGISPIEGDGRFPPYKAQQKGSLVKAARGEDKSLKYQIKNSIAQRKQTLQRYRDRLKSLKGKQYAGERKRLKEQIRQEQLKSRLFKSQSSKAKKISKADLIKLKNKVFYPDSVRSQFPSKRRRPVNLFLSGRFLRELKAVPKRINLIVVGFFSPYGQKLEQGHREEANGQGYRPIIPDTTAGEDFALSLKALILKAYRDSILAYLKKNK